ncbi:MAG TPA: NADH-quinone oxidoreductase subunit NuoF [Myxococcota bacterium]|nr:NADH-quinone oxidoreductase subunit NuoF [Myxococcota bacterium]
MVAYDAIRAGTNYAALVERAGLAERAIVGDEAYSILVGTATCGRAAGALPVLDAFREQVAKAGIEARVMEAGCMGHCYAEPMAVLKRPGYPGMVYHHLNPVIARNLVDNFFLGDDPLLEFFLGATESNELMMPTLMDLPRFGREERRLMRRTGSYDPGDILQAVALGAYAGLARAFELGPESIIAAVNESGLRGMGGAGFPTGRKWAACRAQSERERYIICNADEGDPGAFMDRTILESDPHAVIEGLIIGAIAIGARRGFVYVRAEYPLAVERMRRALDDARRENLLGDDILGAGFSFDVEIAEGAGAFVCGESSALMLSIEGKRGMPRVRPPQSVERGLFGKPTVLDNVKSLANIGPILVAGPENFGDVGTSKSKGTAVFALAGKIVNPGLVEVPMGTTLRELIFDIGGGVPGGKKFKAVQIGGPSGGCLPESQLDTPIDFDKLSAAGAMMGSGGMVVLDEDNCMVETARFFLEFTQDESCGKCTFCRIGTRHMLDILEKIVRGDGSLEDIDRLEELAAEIRDGSLCNLGKTAPNPVLTTLRFFREEYEEHINEKKCRARVCNELTAYYILPDKCARGCDACVGSCPVEAIFTSPKKRIKVIDQSLCTRCDSCRLACPTEYNAVLRISPLVELPAAEPRPDGDKREQS